METAPNIIKYLDSKRVRKAGLWLVIGTSAASTLVVLGELWASENSAEVYILYALVFLLIMTLGLSIGHALLIMHYRKQFQQPLLTIILFASFAFALHITTQETLANHSLWVVRSLYLLVTVWTLASMISLGIALATYLIQRDHALIWLALTLLVYVYTLVILMSRVGPLPILKKILLNEAGAMFSTLVCFGLWILPVGAFTFLYHTARLLSKEFSPKEIKQ